MQWSRKEQSWKSFIMLNGKKHLCGIFPDQIDAIKARDKAILKYGLPTKLQIIKPIEL